MLDKKEIAIMFKEYKHMEDVEVLRSVKTDSLTAEQKQKSIRAVNIIKLKRRGKLKGRM